MEFEGIWHPKYGWIVDNWNSFFVNNLQIRGEDGERGQYGTPVRCTESMVQLQMPFIYTQTNQVGNKLNTENLIYFSVIQCLI